MVDVEETNFNVKTRDAFRLAGSAMVRTIAETTVMKQSADPAVNQV